MEHFESVCKSFGLKKTFQRMAVYRDVMGRKDHPSADMVFRSLRRKIPSISLDTVNRTLIDFSRVGLIHPVECSHKGKQYDPDRKPHHHLKCISCGRVFDFEHLPFNDLKVPARVEKVFKVVHRKVVLSGLCVSCQKAEKNKRDSLSCNKRRKRV